jgi:hypothetical protein
MPKLGANVVVQGGEAGRAEAPDVLVERVDEDRERQILLQFRCRAGEDEVAARLGAMRELPEQPGLADPGFPGQLDRARATSIELGQDLVERSELIGTPNEGLGR